MGVGVGTLPQGEAPTWLVPDTPASLQRGRKRASTAPTAVPAGARRCHGSGPRRGPSARGEPALPGTGDTRAAERALTLVGGEVAVLAHSPAGCELGCC